jgi:hypothetical protein
MALWADRHRAAGGAAFVEPVGALPTTGLSPLGSR